MDARPPLFATSIFIFWSWPHSYFSPPFSLVQGLFFYSSSPPPLILCSLERRAVYSALSTTGIYILLFLIPSLPPACLHTCFTVSFFLYFLFSSCLFLPFISAPPPPIPNFLSPSSSPFPPSSSPPSLLPPSLPLSQGHVLVEVGCEIGAACRRAWWVAQGDRARRALASNCSPDDKQSKNRQQPL